MNRSIRPLAIQLLAIAVVTMTNILFVVVQDSTMEESELLLGLNWGIYAGEFLVVSAWIAWGTGHILRRTVAALLFGGTWAVSSWLAYLIPRGVEAFVGYQQEVLQLLYVPEIALLIITTPLALFRFFGNWQFHLPPTRPTRPTRSSQITLKQIFVVVSILCLALACLCWLPYRRMMDDLMVAAIVGVVLCPVALVTCPLIVTGLMQTRLKIPLVLPPVLVVGSIAWGIGRTVAIPGPGGAGQHVVVLAMTLGLTAVAFFMAASLLWRVAGYRLHRGANTSEPGHD